MMLYLILLFNIVLCDVVIVDHYRKCPPLKPRDQGPKNIRDLRPDDIQVNFLILIQGHHGNG